jgi:hypothetical protein
MLAWWPRSRLGLGAGCVLTSLLVFASYLYLAQSSRYSQPTFSFAAIPDQACDGIQAAANGDNGNNGDNRSRHAIPNLVHYVWLLKNPAELRLDFKAFVSVYSAYVFWRPERIYFHTDAAPETFARAKTNGSPWTKRVLAIPGITPNYIEAPRTTTKGVSIVNMEHKADFLRMAALREFGGVYLDIDAVPLRDISDLRNSGFANVVGGATALAAKHSGYINNGVMMSVPNSTLM